MNTTQFYGTWTALVTPFHRDGHVDWNTFEALIRKQMASSVQGVVVGGTTSESPTLSTQEKAKMLEVALNARTPNKKVILGTGSYNLQEVLSFVSTMNESDVDAFMVITPYYNKPNQKGLFHYFRNIAEITYKPIILYSNPGRCGISIGEDIIEQLHGLYPHICGLKECGTSCTRIADIIKRTGPSFTVLSGDDPMTLPFMSVGAKGVVSVMSNLIPETIACMTSYMLNNQMLEAQEIYLSIAELYYPIVSIDSNPIPIKEAMHQTGLLENPYVRPPLCQTDESNKQIIAKALQHPIISALQSAALKE